MVLKTSARVVQAASAALAQGFMAHGPLGITKTYLALVAGRLEGSGTVDVPLGGKPARSRWAAVRPGFGRLAALHHRSALRPSSFLRRRCGPCSCGRRHRPRRAG